MRCIDTLEQLLSYIQSLKENNGITHEEVEIIVESFQEKDVSDLLQVLQLQQRRHSSSRSN